MPEVHIRPKDSPNKKKRAKVNRPALAMVLILCLISVAGWRLLQRDTSPQPAVTSKSNESISTDSSQTAQEPKQARTLKTFTGAQFVELYNDYAYPNVQEFEASPFITNDSKADERIRSLAIARGYLGRPVAVPPLEDAGSYQLQPRSLPAWENLVTAASKDGHRLTLTAGFRTIEDQRELFLDALYASGATKSSIAAGNSDNAVIDVLRRISIPGYTRHHSGYTVDIGCGSDPNVVFGASACFAWLSRENYKNAKTHGWIPSYPEGAPKQGPDPEEWEYSWVGYETLSTPAD